MNEELYQDVIKTMTGEELDRIQESPKEKEKYLLLDVRGEEEYEEGHVKHAVNFPFYSIADRVQEIEQYKEKPIITVCNTGGKSTKSAKMLAYLGFKNIYNATGVKKFDYTHMTKVKTIMGTKFKELVDSGDYTVLDVRLKEDYDKGHMKKAIHVNPKTIKETFDQLPKDKPFLVYCYHGNAGWMIAHSLVEAGYEAINAMNGTSGYDGYEYVK